MTAPANLQLLVVAEPRRDRQHSEKHYTTHSKRHSEPPAVQRCLHDLGALAGILGGTPFARLSLGNPASRLHPSQAPLPAEVTTTPVPVYIAQ